MQYHAQSLIRQGFDVDIVGYTDSPVLDDLKENATIIGVPKPFPFDECEYLRLKFNLCRLVFAPYWYKYSDFS